MRGGRQRVEISISRVHGDRLRWARVQQSLTMREVRVRGGPSLSYQSEVENGVKEEVHVDLLNAWVRALNVTEEFARGNIQRCDVDPEACRGLAEDVGELIASGRTDLPAWSSLTARDRTRHVLKLITFTSPRFPRVVLAYTLGLSLKTLDDMILGQHPVMKSHMQVISALTALPESFFTQGQLFAARSQVLPGWGDSAATALLTVQELQELVALRQYLPALRLARRAGITPSELQKLVDR